ncbi:MAG: hypothetical protein ACFCUU_10130 [Cyclobacteriaceae bacterium]
MKTFRLILVLFLASCNSQDEFLYTGDLTVTSGRVKGYFSVPIEDYTIGLFDINALQTNKYDRRDAIALGKFVEGKVEFNDINVGNYVVALASTFFHPPRKTIQIQAGRTTTIDLFD